MATIRQIEANRRNALRSTGPRTPEGKQAARFNALKHGIDAGAFVIPGEDPAELESLAARYYEQFSPDTAVARYLVDTLVQCDWNRRRLLRLQARVFRAFAPSDEPAETGGSSVFGPDALNRIFRQLSTMERHYFRALAELRTAAARNPGPEPEFQPEPVPSPPVEDGPPPAPPHAIGFVPKSETASAVAKPTAPVLRRDVPVPCPSNTNLWAETLVSSVFSPELNGAGIAYRNCREAPLHSCAHSGFLRGGA